MNDTFQETALILTMVDYATDFVDANTRTVNWSGIWKHEAENDVADWQRALTRLAVDASTSNRTLADLSLLSPDRVEIVLNAVR